MTTNAQGVALSSDTTVVHVTLMLSNVEEGDRVLMLSDVEEGDRVLGSSLIFSTTAI